MDYPFAHTDPKALIRERDLARRWQKSLRTLQRWRRAELGPAWLRIGTTVYYRIEDIHAFELAKRRPGWVAR
jgi:hypothetical protein